MNRERERERQRRYRQGVRAEDSTAGKADLNPRTFKKDVPIQAWMESRYLATLSEWLDQSGRTKFMSEIVQEGIRVLVDHLVNAGEVEMINNPSNAIEILEWKYGVNLSNRRRRGAKNAAHNEVLAERVVEGRLDGINYDAPRRPLPSTDSIEQEKADFMRKMIEAEQSGAVQKVAARRMIGEAKEREADNMKGTANIGEPGISENDMKGRIAQEKAVNMPIMPQSAPVKLDE